MATATAPLQTAASTTSLHETFRTRRPNNAVWFELPVANLNRAVHFYETALATRLKTDPRFPGLAMFPRSNTDSVTGALIETGNGAPSIHGTVIYLNCDGDLDGVIKRAQANGAVILKEVAPLPGNMGFIAQIRDPEGNRVGLHAAY